jgi:hypothetical protein
VPGSASGGGGTVDVEAEFEIVKGVSVGGRATFGFDVAYRIGQAVPEGTLSFTDHELGKKVQATVIDSFHVAAGKATFTGRATVDKVPGVRFEVVVQDGGEPGRNDTFQIITADGYLAGGTLAKGNIEVESDPNSIFSVDIG